MIIHVFMMLFFFPGTKTSRRGAHNGQHPVFKGVGRIKVGAIDSPPNRDPGNVTRAEVCEINARFYPAVVELTRTIVVAEYCFYVSRLKSWKN